jgi:hypothetical protein
MANGDGGKVKIPRWIVIAIIGLSFTVVAAAVGYGELKKTVSGTATTQIEDRANNRHDHEIMANIFAESNKEVLKAISDLTVEVVQVKTEMRMMRRNNNNP